VAIALTKYLESVKGMASIEKMNCLDRTEMIRSIMKVQLDMMNKDKDSLAVSNALWGIILVGFFKGNDNITQNEIQLYLAKQEKAEGRNRSKAALAAKAERKNAVMESFLVCFEEWKSREGMPVSSSSCSDIPLKENAFSNTVVAKHESLIDTIVRTKGFDAGERMALQTYEVNFMNKMGRLMYFYKPYDTQ
jgi:hypothetical protein